MGARADAIPIVHGKLGLGTYMSPPNGYTS
jgi:hypothetical protein